MSVDKLGATSPANIAAIIAGELAALAADAQTLGARLSTGDIVAAVVLPSNGLTDLLEIGGLRVAAELPPTLLPGDSINVRVVGFLGDRINLQVMPPGSSGTEESGVPAAAAAQVAKIRKAAGRAPAAAGAENGLRQKPAPPPTTAGLPRASVPTAPAPAVPRPAAAEPAETPSADAAVPRGVRGRASQPVFTTLEPIEARLATAHATTKIGGPPIAPGSGTVAARLPAGGTGRPPPPKGPVVPRPVVSSRTPISPPPASARAITSPPATARAVTASPARAAGPTAFSEPAALLRALRLPVTATNIASARMALESPERVPNALATLARALANTTDPRVATLSTLAEFLARLEPRSPVFATQIEAFVDQVVTGPEAKLAQLAHAVDDAVKAGAEGAGAVPLDERAAVTRAALDYDLKTQLLAFNAEAAGESDPLGAKAGGLNDAVAGALTAITALQLKAAVALAANPDGLSFSIPVAVSSGFAQARIRIDRDAPGTASSALNGDNFHLGFVLETQHLGTVGIDVLTVGRSVTLSLKTEGVAAQRVFGKALGDLTTRLEKLHYRIARADALVAPPAAPAASNRSASADAPSPAAGTDPDRLVDLDA